MSEFHPGSLLVGLAIGLPIGLSMVLPSIQRYRRKVRQTELTRQDLNESLQQVNAERVEAFSQGWERGHSGAPKYDVIR